MDIQQGNVVTSKMMLQLRPGMTRSQVRFIMGTPLIQDSFHSNRWDYFYQMRKDGRIIEQRRVILEFENEGLVRVRGDVIPAGSGQQDLATPATTPESASKGAAAKPKKEDKGLVDKLKFWKSDEEKKKADEQPVIPVIPVVPETGPVPAPEAAVPAVTAPAEAAATLTPATADAESEKPVPAEKPPAAEPIADTAPDSVKVEPVVIPEAVTAPAELPAEDAGAAPSAVPAGVVEPSGDSVQLIMDHSINLPADAANPGNVSNPSHAPVTDLPPEASPDFFERMLEKIGF